MSLNLVPIRLAPAADLRQALENAATSEKSPSAFVVAGIGSLVDAHLRYAGKATETRVAGPMEILTLSGTLTPDGAHLHMSVSDTAGRVYGGHVGYGNIIRTTAEILLVLVPDGSLSREHDPATGFQELVVRRQD